MSAFAAFAAFAALAAFAAFVALSAVFTCEPDTFALSCLLACFFEIFLTFDFVILLLRPSVPATAEPTIAKHERQHGHDDRRRRTCVRKLHESPLM